MRTKENKYDQLLNAAMLVIKETGFEKASVSQFVRRAGVAQGTFYLYFSSKKEIVPAIAERILSEQLLRIKKREKEADHGEGLLRLLIEETFAVTEEFRDLISFCYAGISLYYSFERWDEIYRPYYEWLMERLNKLQEKGEVTSGMKTEYLANYTIGLIEHGAEAHYLSQAVQTDENEAQEQLYYFVSRAVLL